MIDRAAALQSDVFKKLQNSLDELTCLVHFSAVDIGAVSGLSPITACIRLSVHVLS